MKKKETKSKTKNKNEYEKKKQKKSGESKLNMTKRRINSLFFLVKLTNKGCECHVWIISTREERSEES